MRNTPIRLRLSLSYLIVLIAGMSLAMVLAWISVEKLYLDTQRENLLAQARLVAANLHNTPLAGSVGPYSQTGNALPGIHTHVLSDEGMEIVPTPRPSASVLAILPLAENVSLVSPGEFMWRPEIQQALTGTPSTGIHSPDETRGQRALYAAAPILDADGRVSGIVYLATPLPSTGLPLPIIGQLAGAVLFAGLMASAAGALLARHIAVPLESLARSAEAVAAGDLKQMVPTNSSDIAEVHSLAIVFNAMIASLRQSDQTKTAFIADVTHELRTPLTVIKGTIETLEDGALDDHEGRGLLLSSMQRETDRLIRLVNDLLVLTRADAGALQLRIQPLDMVALAHQRCEHLTSLAARRKVELCVDACADLPLCALGDPDRVAQIFDNLLDNAIRYAPENSVVTVSIRQEGNEINCEVSDHGPGIPAQHLPLIFERFYRIDASRNRQTGGAGLGLSIVRALVLAQGGRIEARCHEGTIIRFHLPLAEPAIQLPKS